MAGFSTAVRRSGLPPGSGLLFRSFAVRFVHGLYLEFVLFVRSVRFQFVSFSSCRSFCIVRFELIFPFAPAHMRFSLLFFAYIIHVNT